MNPPNHIYKPGSVVMANGARHPVDDGEERILPFPLQHLPPAARDMAEAIARTERTPETLAGCCVLGFLSASIGAGLQVTSGTNRMTRGNLYIMPSAESGSGKSETFRHAAKPFFAIEREMVERWEAEVLPSFQAEKEMLESEIGKLKKDASKGKTGMEREEIKNEMQAKKKALADVDAMLIAPALCCEDVTTEKLAVMLGHNQEQLASLSPDAGSIVNNLLGRYSKLDRTDEGIYLKAFSGDNCRVDRQGREPVLLQRPCLAALWLVQPDKIETLLGKSELTDGGMIPRLLVCHTRAMPISEDGQTGLLVSTSRSLKTGAVRKLHEDAAIWWAKNTNVVRTRTGISSRCSLARLAMLPGTDLTILVNTRAPAPLRLGRI